MGSEQLVNIVVEVGIEHIFTGDPEARNATTSASRNIRILTELGVTGFTGLLAGLNLRLASTPTMIMSQPPAGHLRRLYPCYGVPENETSRNLPRSSRGGLCRPLKYA